MPIWPSDIGPYFWFIIAIVLAGAELMVPGFFMLWLGIAAALTGLIHLIAPFNFSIEILIFIVVSATLILATWRMVTQSWNAKTDAPHLNLRHGAFIGKTFALHEAIKNGSGKVVVEDVMWDVEGSDLEKGTAVKVTAINGMRLIVVKA